MDELGNLGQVGSVLMFTQLKPEILVISTLGDFKRLIISHLSHIGLNSFKGQILDKYQLLLYTNKTVFKNLDV